MEFDGKGSRFGCGSEAPFSSDLVIDERGGHVDGLVEVLGLFDLNGGRDVLRVDEMLLILFPEMEEYVRHPFVLQIF